MNGGCDDGGSEGQGRESCEAAQNARQLAGKTVRVFRRAVVYELEHCFFFLDFRSGTDEMYMPKDQLLCEALALYEEATRKRKVEADEKGSKAESKKREEVVKIRDDAAKTLGQKQTFFTLNDGTLSLPLSLFLFFSVFLSHTLSVLIFCDVPPINLHMHYCVDCCSSQTFVCCNFIYFLVNSCLSASRVWRRR